MATVADCVALLAWARAQSDLTVDGHRVALRHSRHRWLQPSDPRVLALFTDHAGPVARADIVTALVSGGTSLGSAEVWTVRCSWQGRPAVEVTTSWPAARKQK